MARCHPHRQQEPCYYCRIGYGSFTSTDERLEALEGRIRALEIGDKTLENMDIREAIGVVRDYALGDLVMLSPSLKALKKKNPKRPLVLVTNPSLFDVLDGADYLDAILPKHTYAHAAFYRTYDVCSAAEVEGPGKLPEIAYRSMPRPDIFAKLLGVKTGATQFPVPINKVALLKMQVLLTGSQHPIIGLASTCQSPVRTIPAEYIEPLTKRLLQIYKSTVVLVGKTDNWNRHLANLRISNVINLIDTLSIKELIAISSLMDIMISPDTGTMHIAGALGVKCLALMGNNKPKHFSDFYSTVKVLQPSSKELPCVPCEDIKHQCLPMPPGIFGAPCMRAMTPEKICKAFGEFYNG